MAHLLEKTRKITSILKRSEEQLQEELPYNAITRQLADIIDCNACIVNSKGRLLGYFMRYKTNTDRVEQFFQTKIFLVFSNKCAIFYLAYNRFHYNIEKSLFQ